VRSGPEDRLALIRRYYEAYDISDHALIRYHASAIEGAGFSNVEHFEFRDDLISHVDCYFGPPVPEQTTSNWGARPA
jgi:hypothetical protein